MCPRALPLPLPELVLVLGSLELVAAGGGSAVAEDFAEASTPRSLAWAAAALDEELPGAGGAVG